MDLLNLLTNSMTTDSSVKALSKKAGISADQTSKLVSSALPILLQQMTNNASSTQGAQSLLGALNQHTNTGTMAAQIADADEEDGNKILGHILGGNATPIYGALANQMNMQPSQVSQVLGCLAPALLSGLSAATQSAVQVQPQNNGFDLSGLMSMFGAQPQPVQQPSLLGSLFGGGGGNSGGGLGGLLGSLLGGAPAQNQNAMNGNALLNILTALMR